MKISGHVLDSLFFFFIVEIRFVIHLDCSARSLYYSERIADADVDYSVIGLVEQRKKCSRTLKFYCRTIAQDSHNSYLI